MSRNTNDELPDDLIDKLKLLNEQPDDYDARTDHGVRRRDASFRESGELARSHDDWRAGYGDSQNE